MCRGCKTHVEHDCAQESTNRSFFELFSVGSFIEEKVPSLLSVNIVHLGADHPSHIFDL
jgi:hypothetical protein